MKEITLFQAICERVLQIQIPYRIYETGIISFLFFFAFLYKVEKKKIIF